MPDKKILKKIKSEITKALKKAETFSLMNKDKCYRIVLIKNEIDSPSKLKNRIKATELMNKYKVPYIDNLTCHTCGAKGLSNPETSYCFVCDTDNW